MATPHEGNTEPDSTGPSSLIVLALAGLVAAAVVVFDVLPRWAIPPVVTTAPSASPLATTPHPVPPPDLAATPPRVPGPGAPPRLVEPAPPLKPRDEPPARDTDRTTPLADVPRSVSDLSSSSEFDAAVSEGLAALDRGALAQARAAFARAEAVRPGTGVVKDGVARADAAQRAEALDGHRKRAETAEAVEDWRKALSEYEAALRLERAVRFAVEGVARASVRADLADRLDAYLRRPDRLSAEEVAREAEIALDRASEIASPGPRLLRQIDELRGHLAAAGTTVTVRLLSDERTEVSVQRVGPLGRFREKTLELRPGSYVVVGTRRGYRDRRHTLVVPPGRSPEPLTVRCDEAL